MHNQNTIKNNIMEGRNLTKQEIHKLKSSLEKAADNHDEYPFEVRDCGCQMNCMPVRACSCCGEYYTEEEWKLITTWCDNHNMMYLEDGELKNRN